MEFCVVSYGGNRYEVFEVSGDSTGIKVMLIIWAVFSDLFASFALPVISYFVFIKDNPVLAGLAQSIPMLLASAFVWFININLFFKFVLKKDIFKKLTVSLATINRIIRYMLILGISVAMVSNLIPSVTQIESEMFFGAMFAYNFIFAIIEMIVLIKAECVGKKILFSLLIAFVGACIIGAIAMEIEVLKPVMFEIVTLSALVLLEISILLFKKFSNV